uniref:vWA domain-containing protein n=1 Tax=uncultured Flavonifractor sp. TaxID=1193534 RepID=UPI002625143B
MDRDNRIDTAKSEAIKFAEQVLDPTSGAGNRVAVVSFDGNIGSEPDYTTQCGLSANLDAVSSAINGIITGGGTNIQAGIMAARTLLQNSTADNQVIILLSDGEPQKSYRPVGTGVWENCSLHTLISGKLGDWSWTGFDYTREVGGAGASYTDMTSGYLGTVVATCSHGKQRYFEESSPYSNHGDPTIAEAKIAKDAGCEIYTVYLRDPQDDDSAAEHAQYTLSKVANEGDGHYLTPAAVSDLAEAFESIAQSVLVPTEAGSVTDTMGEYVTLDLTTISDKANVAISDDGKSFTWNLTNVEPVVNEETGTKTYTLTYQVTLNTEQEGFENGKAYATNGDASFTYTIKDTSSTITILGTESPMVSGGPVTKTITVKFVDKDNKEVDTDEMTVDASATEIALNKIKLPTEPKFLRLTDGQPKNLTIKEGQVTVFVERYVGVNYYIPAENRNVEGKVVVAFDATQVHTSALTDVPEGYELVSTGDIPINDGWIFVEVRPAAETPETKEVGVNYWDIENNKQAGEGKVTVAADADKVNTSALTDVPEGYELVSTG